MEKPNRADKYQYIICELVLPEKSWDLFKNKEDVSSQLREELLALDDLLGIEYNKIINSVMTKRQAEVYKLCKEGNNQLEVAKILGCNQSSVYKALHGNDLLHNGQIKRYGGLLPKFRKAINKSDKILQIMKEIEPLYDERVYLPFYRVCSSVIPMSSIIPYIETIEDNL